MRAHVLLLAVLLTLPLYAATLSDIHRDKLHQDEAVQQALDRIVPIEDLVNRWNGEWNGPVSKEQVQETVSMGLSVLQRAAISNPKNEEIQLAIALLAHYAYNVDLNDAELQMNHALDTARALNQQDYRTTWFFGYHQCQTLEAAKGMTKLEALEAIMPWKQFPLDYWDDYLACSITSNVPAHGLRAMDHVKELYPSMLEPRLRMKSLLEKRSIASEVTKEYEPKQIWSYDKDGTNIRFTAFACGVGFTVKGTDELNLLDVKQGQCTVVVNTGPYKGNKRSMSPSLMLISRPAKQGESLEDFQKASFRDREFETIAPSLCPAEHCLTATSVKAGGYEKEGDGHLVITVIEREMPQYPGLMLEEPAMPQIDENKKDEIQYFHADERINRFSGKRYYMVVLESSTSVLKSAKADYAAFLKSLIVE